MKPEDRFRVAPRRVTLRDGRCMTIRLLEASDAPAIVDFYAAFRPEDGVYYLPPRARSRDAALKRATMADSPYEVCLVLADDGGVIHGEAWYRWSETRQTQSTFGIGLRHTLQGVGAGRLVMTCLMDIGDAYGPPVMDLTVQLENERAWKLYTSMGFVVVRQQMRPAREDAPPMPEYYMERAMGGIAARGAGSPPVSEVPDPRDDGARRAYWTARMDEADVFMRHVAVQPVAECNEPMVSLVEAVRQAGVEVLFAGRPHAMGLPRLFFLRKGLVPSFLAAAGEANARGWVLRVEDGYRTVTMQRGLALQDALFAAILRKVRWEIQGRKPAMDLLVRRVGALLASAPKVGTHMSGSAVDVSVLDRVTGIEVDRGCPYLDMSERTPMDSPFVSAGAGRNRREITALMGRHGFVAYPWEFWHYNAGDAYAEALNRTGQPARYGAVHLDLTNGAVTPVDEPGAPLVAPETMRATMERVWATLPD